MSVPTRPSNRHLYETMQAWGWTTTKTKGGFAEMEYHHNGSRTKISVALPGHGEATRDPVIKNVIQVTTGGDRELFWNKHHAQVTETIGKALTESIKVLRATGASREVLNFLIEHSVAMPIKSIQAAFPQFDPQSVTAACTYLVEIGNAERVMRGMYRATIRHQHGSTVHHDVQGGIGHVTEPPKVVLEPAQMEKPEPAPTEPFAPLRTTNKPARVTPKPENDDETMNVLLDLMFPEGMPSFQLWPAIEAWKKATLKLMKEVRK